VVFLNTKDLILSGNLFFESFMLLHIRLTLQDVFLKVEVKDEKKQQLKFKICSATVTHHLNRNKLQTVQIE